MRTRVVLIDAVQVDPFLEWHKALGGQELMPHQEAVIDAAAANLKHVPRP